MADIKYLYQRSKHLVRTEGIRGFLRSSSRYFMSNVLNSERYYRTRFRLRQLNQSRKHGPVPHAFEMKWVSPEDINRISNTSPSVKWKKAGIVESGDWDLSETLFEEYDLYNAIQQRFEQGLEWKETNFYNRVESQIEDGQTKWGCQTISEFDSRCLDLENLYQSIKKNGYIPRSQLIKKKDETPSTDNFAAISNSCLYKYDEIAVDIDRNGEFLFIDGRNRLSICKILDVDEIPVRVVRRHKSWQDYRRAISENEKNGIQHPDCVDLINK